MIIIGMMLCMPEDNDLACQKLKIMDFFETKHQIIFSSLLSLYEKGKPSETQLLIQDLKDQNNLTSVGGIEYLSACKDAALSSYEIENYIDIVIEKSMKREFIIAAQKSLFEASNSKENAIYFIESLSQQLSDISKKQFKGEFVLLKEIIQGRKEKDEKSFLEVLQERQERALENKGCHGISSGFPTLDETLNGFLPGHLIILAARPGIGKTTLALSFIIEAAIRNKKPVGVFSLEMSPLQLIEKMISNYSEIPLSNISKGAVDDCWVEITETVNEIQDAPIHFYDSFSMNISSIIIAAKRMKEVHGIEMIVIDYLQLISGSAKFKSSDSRVNEVSEISRSLKLLAMELKIPIICLSQLNRNVESRSSQRPMLSDLRESGSIEQDADDIMLLYQPVSKDPTSLHKSEYIPMTGRINLDIAKNRFGQTREILLTSNYEVGRFMEFDEFLKNERKKTKEGGIFE